MSDDVETPIHSSRAGSRRRRSGTRKRGLQGSAQAASGVAEPAHPAALRPVPAVLDEPHIGLEPGLAGPPAPPDPPDHGDGGGDGPGGEGRPPRPKLRKLRILAVFLGLGTLAFISTIFGMMMAVASDVPQLENRQQYKHAANSFLYDDHWRPIGIFAPPDHVVLDNYDQIAPAMRYAIISIEDKRFMTDPGVDIRGIARALISDITGGATQGASTITEQFVKNALQAQNNRTVLEKLREAALAFQLSHLWPKDRILADYLDTAYFGNGAYSVEAAARAYFANVPGGNLYGCGASPNADNPASLCVTNLTAEEAALLAATVDAPTTFNGLQNATAALDRRNLMLRNMQAQGF
ncbi:MAG TPA: biosynthetic peptidoglycan transglycosylase, partial [Solirubrobacteraceae bacterium]